MLLAAACSASPISDRGTLSRAEVPAAIEAARATPPANAAPRELAKIVGDLLRATRSELDAAERVAVQTLLDDAATELAERGDDPDVLEDLIQVDLPARIAVPAGLRAARIWLEDKDRSDAFAVIQRLDERYPSHALGGETGEILYAIAASYRDDKGRRLFLFPYSARAPAVFEYLSTEYPTHARTDDALRELARTYEDARRFDLAIERHEDLLLWSQDSPFRAESEATIPMLRLADLDGPAYGRDQMLRALSELDAWVERWADHPLRPDVDRSLVDCLQRLADNDLVVARFYRRVKNPTGARNHAERGIRFARRAGNAEQEAELVEFLASIDEIEAVEAPTLLPGGAPGIEAFDPAGTGTSGPAPLAPSEPLDPDSRRRDRRVEPAPEAEAAGGGQ
ncbi:MAG: hypothetical protein AAFR54_12480 [Planctomycetota bacterium]